MLLFVYGTLRSEFDNRYARLLRAEADLVGRATVMGSIFRVADYPGYRPEPAGEVHGEVYKLRDPERTLAALDDWEGEQYTRVKTAGGFWIYQYKTQPPIETRIASGDFFAP